MNWRRGILLAGIHLAIAVPLIVMLDVQEDTWVREHSASQAKITEEPAPKNASSGDEGETVTLNPCAMWVRFSPEDQLASLANLPALTLSGWRQICPPHWTLAGRLNVGYTWIQSSSAIRAGGKVDWGFWLLIAVQWILVGEFPLIGPKRWWAEPGAFITFCAVIAFGLVFIRPVAELARVPVLLAALAWLWWLGLLVWTGVRFAWKHLRSVR